MSFPHLLKIKNVLPWSQYNYLFYCILFLGGGGGIIEFNNFI